MIGREIWTLFSYRLYPKIFLTWLSYQQLREKLSRIIHPKWTSWFRSCRNLHERYHLLFLNVYASLKDYFSALHMENKANSRTPFGTIFFLNLISFKEPQNLKTVKESRNKVEYTGLLWMVIKGDIDGLVCYKPAVDSLFSNILGFKPNSFYVT